MYCIADSGSSICDWIVLDGNEKITISTIGFNPFFHDTDFIIAHLAKSDLLKYAEGITEINYYGAGCGTEMLRKKLTKSLSQFFKNANITVGTDLAGAVLATCDNQPGIACILGTGSNSCYFDGEKIIESAPALGFILGEEGSGTYFGKLLLRDFMYGRLPSHIEESLQDHYKLNKEVIYNNVYMKPNANVYLASFMRFLSQSRNDEYIQNFIYNGFSDFIRFHIWSYEDYRTIPVHFVGSIAHYFEPILQKASYNHQFKLGKIVRKPVEELIKVRQA